MDRDFVTMLRGRWKAGKFLCVGLDTDADRVPLIARHGTIEQTLFSFNRSIVERTADLVAAFKPNIAFYEQHGVGGLRALSKTIDFIRSNAPEVPVIIDAKRGDIASTNRGYVRAIVEMGGDALTVHPYLGREALAPFLERNALGIFVLCRTSNSGASELQDLKVGKRRLYEIVAQNVATDWNRNGNCGLVVGATYPSELARVRSLAPEIPILIPGVGAQGGDIKRTVRAGLTRAGDGILINASRSIIYASEGDDFADAARSAALELDEAFAAAMTQ